MSESSIYKLACSAWRLSNRSYTRRQPRPLPQAAPSLAQIEATWRPHFRDDFTSNYPRWGVGHKHNGICRIERTLANGRYGLTLHNEYHEDVFMGGDSNCFAPPIYYLTVRAQLLQGDHEADGYGLLFEAINDECYAFFRVRETMRRISVVQTHNGGDDAKVYLRQLPAFRYNQGNRTSWRSWRCMTSIGFMSMTSW